MKMVGADVGHQLDNRKARLGYFQFRWKIKGKILHRKILKLSIRKILTFPFYWTKNRKIAVLRTYKERLALTGKIFSSLSYENRKFLSFFNIHKAIQWQILELNLVGKFYPLVLVVTPPAESFRQDFKLRISHWLNIKFNF